MNHKLQAIGDRALGALTEKYQLKAVAADESPQGAVVLYQNATSAVRMSVEHLEGRVFVNLFRPKNGHVPLYYDIEERRKDPLNGFDLDDLIALRAPDAAVEQKPREALTDAGIERILGEYAIALETHADDFLRGHFSVFRPLALRVAERAEKLKEQGYYVGPEYESLLDALRRSETNSA